MAVGLPLVESGALVSAMISIVPAVPSSSGLADVFAFQNDGTVQAITSDGTTAWTADVSQGYSSAPVILWPDFQGGLVVCTAGYSYDSISKLDGITGQPVPYGQHRREPGNWQPRSRPYRRHHLRRSEQMGSGDMAPN